MVLCLDVPDRQGKSVFWISFGGFKLLPKSDAAARRLYYCLDERNKHVSASPTPTEGDSKTWEKTVSRHSDGSMV